MSLFEMFFYVLSLLRGCVQPSPGFAWERMRLGATQGLGAAPLIEEDWSRCPRGSSLTFCIAQKVPMVRPAPAQPCATAHQPSLVARKTHFDFRSFAFGSVLLSRLFRFHFAVSRNRLVPMCPDFFLKQHLRNVRTVSSDMQPLPEMVLFIDLSIFIGCVQPSPGFAWERMRDGATQAMC